MPEIKYEIGTITKVIFEKEHTAHLQIVDKQKAPFIEQRSGEALLCYTMMYRLKTIVQYVDGRTTCTVQTVPINLLRKMTVLPIPITTEKFEELWTTFGGEVL